MNKKWQELQAQSPDVPTPAEMFLHFRTLREDRHEMHQLLEKGSLTVFDGISLEFTGIVLCQTFPTDITQRNTAISLWFCYVA